MKINKYFVIDFDSTFTKVEAFDALAEISLKDHPDFENRKKLIAEITNQGMDGSISFRESLEKRVQLLSPNRRHLEQLVVMLKELVSESFKRNKEFFSSTRITSISFPMDFMPSSIRSLQNMALSLKTFWLTVSILMNSAT